MTKQHGLYSAALLVLALGAAGCDGPTPPPPAIAAITVTSPIGDRLAIGRAVTLDATARDAQGNDMTSVTFSWSSSAGTVASVDASGTVSGVTPGTVSISASAEGVSGSLALRVLNVDLNAVTGILSDPFARALLANLTASERGRVQAALDQCAAGVVSGDFRTIDACVASARAEVSGASDATDRALLASLALFLDHIERLLDV
ncbi:MAG: Ig-like domain-containing protein [Gemmatimonadales bacterium]